LLNYDAGSVRWPRRDDDAVARGCDDNDGKTTARIYTAVTFLRAAWDFIDEPGNGTADVWRALEGHDYPRLSWQLPAEGAPLQQ
jgi:hypothetical protein